MVAVRTEMLVFAVKLQLMVPELLPLAPAEIESQLLSGVITAAFHCIDMIPVPEFETPNVVAPASLSTLRLAGAIAKIYDASTLPPRTQRT
jgi:hypothetical protein